MTTVAADLMPVFTAAQAVELEDLLTHTSVINGVAPSYATLGDTIITNGTFAGSLTGWTSTGWTYSAGTAVHTAGNTNALSQSVAVEANTYYLIQSTIVGVEPMAGISNIYVNGTLVTGYNTIETAVPSTNYCLYQSGAAALITFEVRPTTNFVSAYSNISMKPLTANAVAALTINAAIDNLPLSAFFGSFTSGNMGVGPSTLIHNATGQNNVGIGKNVLSTNVQGSENTGIGSNALRQNGTGYANTAIGYSALNSNTSGFSNTAIGGNALVANTYGTYNTAVGLGAMSTNVSGISNVAVGVNALYTSTGNYNVGIGSNALGYNNPNTGTHNNALGIDSGRAMTSGQYNEFIGYEAGFSNTTGTGNDVIGHQAFRSNVAGNNNVVIGYQAGTNMTGGLQNTIIGASASATQTSGNSNICIGFSTVLPDLAGNNQLNIGNFIYGNLSTKQVVWGQSAVVAGATLALVSTTQGFLPPKMTTAQRDAIATPPAGLIIFNTTTNKLNVYGAAAWEQVTSV